MSEGLTAGTPLAAFLRQSEGDDAVAFLARVGAGLLLLHEQNLVPQSGTITVGALTSSRPRLGVDGFRVFPLVNPDPSTPFVSIGRTTGNAVQIPDGTISRFHAYFRVDGEVVRVWDAGSKHGTFVADKPAPQRDQGDGAVVRSGDSVRFGSIPFTFVTPTGFRAFASRLLLGSG
jgi:hypothetical protein